MALKAGRPRTPIKYRQAITTVSNSHQHLFIAGLMRSKKAKAAAEILYKRAENLGIEFTDTNTEFVGLECMQ